jgi:hypothetical protein
MFLLKTTLCKVCKKKSANVSYILYVWGFPHAQSYFKIPLGHSSRESISFDKLLKWAYVSQDAPLPHPCRLQNMVSLDLLHCSFIQATVDILKIYSDPHDQADVTMLFVVLYTYPEPNQRLKLRNNSL